MTRRRVVISQPMLFPWPGFLEQLGMADVYVHYDDVQFSKGSFTNRVQLKTAKGPAWMTVPLRDLHLGQHIRDVVIDDRQDWRARHLDLLEKSYAQAPFRDAMLALVREVYAEKTDKLSRLAIASQRALAQAFGVTPARELFSSALEIPGSSSGRVLEVVRRLEGTTYITGQGAKNYLDHPAFEAAGVAVEYMRYACQPYSQLHGAFTPYVSGLDLLANQGPQGRAVFVSRTVPWKEFTA